MKQRKVVLDMECRIGHVTFSGGMPKICVPLTGTELSDLMSECELARNSAAELVEWRVDFFKDALRTEKVLAVLPKLKESLDHLPLIFSFRTKDEGGEQAVSLEQYVSLNKAVAASGYIDGMDIEWFKKEHEALELVEVAKENRVTVILSNHDFAGTPERDELVNRVERALQLGADIPKLAVMPKCPEDVLNLLDVSLTMKRTHPEQAAIMIAMGKLGVVTRLSGEIFGSSITFATLKNASAPGQIAAGKMKEILELIHSGN